MSTEVRQKLPPDEPVLDVHEIQGNALPGFMKPHMVLLLLAIGDAGKARAWLRQLVHSVTTLAQVMESRVKVRQARTLRPRGAQIGAIPAGLDDLWLNIAFTYAGLKRLADGGAGEGRLNLDRFSDQAFRLGLAARSSLLGDPTDPAAEGHPSNWVVGGPGREPHILLVVAGDSAMAAGERAGELAESAREHELDVIHEDRGDKFDAIGSEHFGFQDGISQPGVRGRLSDAPGHFLAHRRIDPMQVPDAWLYGLPGQLLVWPGEFVFGYPGASADPLLAGPVKRPGPEWSRNGSYLVFRRLRQDVAGFWRFMAAEAERLSAEPGFEGWTDHRLAAALVGRWKSGAPLVRAPAEDDESLGADREANNTFGFAQRAGTLNLIDGETTNGRWPEAVADPIGLVCPLAAHIRKVNSRAAANDLGASRAGLDRRLLRVGLPYGKPLRDPGEVDPENGDRGLLFVSYQTSIADQFEFLNTQWMGSPVNPRSPSGFDMVVGQNGHPGQGRVRRCVLFGEGLQQATVKMTEDYVIPTGGGYFFSPSISALRHTLAGD